MSKQSNKILIYGANGYTGKLIVEHALQCDIKPIIAGRNLAELNLLAKKDELEVRCFDLNSIPTIIENLKDIALVIHCAGPFSATASPMMRACISSRTHYTDITGEIEVFELAQKLHQEALSAGIIICPGVGFDVIPTDCLASQLKQKMPDATHLSLGFDSASSLSPGTAQTSIEGLGQGGKIRRDGKIIKVPLAFKTRSIDFGNGEKNAMTIPWGDVSTAFYSTGIPNIEVYIPISPKRAKSLKRLNWFRWLLALSPIQKMLKNKAKNSSKGPNAEQRSQLPTYIWGEVSNPNGKKISARFSTANGYQLTYLGAIEIAKYILNTTIEGGAYTPSLLVDDHLVNRLAGTSEIVFVKH